MSMCHRRLCFALPAVITIVVLLCLPVFPAVVHVKQDSPTPASGGPSWDSAYHSVTEALAYAIAGDEVWVAAADYTGCVTLKPGIGLYGGFSGLENARDLADPELNKTSLSAGDWWNNCGTILTLQSGAGRDTIISGFVIRNGATGINCVNASPTITNNRITGNADSGIWIVGGGPLVNGNAITDNTSSTYWDPWEGWPMRVTGGGIYCENSTAVIDGNLIDHNSAAYEQHYSEGGNSYGWGGGIYVKRGSPRISNNSISRNFVANTGGGVYIEDSTAVLEGNTITGNDAYADIYRGERTGWAGGIYIKGGSVTLSDNSIGRNTSQFSGGSVWIEEAQAEITGNSIFENKDDAVYCHKSGVLVSRNRLTGNYGRSIHLKDCAADSLVASNVVAGNASGISSSGTPGMLANNTVFGNAYFGIESGGGPLTVANNIVSNGSRGIIASGGSVPTLITNCVYNNANGDYAGIQAGARDISADPRFASPDYGNLHIQPNSPCRNAGTDLGIPGISDIDNQPVTDGQVDIGADETDGTVHQPGPYTVLHVRANGNDDSDGLTWQTAKKTVATAVSDAAQIGGQVWVGAGSYSGGVELPPFVQLYGGFNGTETSVEQRNWSRNRSSVTSVAVRSGWTKSIVDGFSIGLGVGSEWSSPIISHSILPGGIACADGDPVISGNVVTGSTGCGVQLTSCGGYVLNNTIVAAASEGIRCRGSKSLIANNIVTSCLTGMFSTGAGPVLRNNCIYGNLQKNYDGIAAGTGDVNKDPRLADPVTGNFHIQRDSPCRDAGWDDATSYAGRDIDCGIRPVGKSIDIGADESTGGKWPVVPRRVYYVAANGNNNNEGLSWIRPKQTIQAAIDAARFTGAEVWVKEGIYKEWISVRPNVYLYGGFAGVETKRDQRDWGLRKSVIDGRHVTTPVSIIGGGPWAVLDGFTITNGEGVDGGGIYCDGSSATIQNNTITDSYAVGDYTGITEFDGNGGGIYCQGGSPTIRDNYFTRNECYMWGSAILCYGGSPTISGNRIIGNTYGDAVVINAERFSITDNLITGNEGYGISTLYGPWYDWSRPNYGTITNNIVSGNLVGIGCQMLEGTIANNAITANYGTGLTVSRGPVEILNNTIVSNGLDHRWGGYGLFLSSYDTWGIPEQPGVYLVKNNIVAFNKTGVGSYGKVDSTFSCNCIYGNNMQFWEIADPTGSNGNVSLDPIFADVQSGNTHIQTNSPCVDGGDNTAESLIASDIDGQKRRHGNRIDMGADESYGTVWPAGPSAIIRIAPNGNDGNDGLSWSRPKKSIGAGICAAAAFGGQVWVKEGLYRERIVIPSHVRVSGGFAGTELLLSDRSIAEHQTVLDGENYRNMVDVKAQYPSDGIDGFTLIHGQDGYESGAIYCSSGATVADNRICMGGGGIYAGGSANIISNLLIGCGISGYDASPLIANNTIVAAKEAISFDSQARIINNIAAFNYRGIWVADESDAVVANNCAFGNTMYNLQIDEGSNNITVDPGFANPALGDFSLLPGSPCVNIGDTSVIGDGSVDLAGRPRVQGSQVDLGAIEFDKARSRTAVIFYVSPSGNDLNDGLTWASAKKTVQAGIDAASLAGGQVWVSKGTYKEPIEMWPFAYLYGGFEGSRTVPGRRDWNKYPSILDGESKRIAVTARNGHTWSAIDGFIITGGADIYNNGYENGAIACLYSSPLISHNTISGNKGAAVYCEVAGPVIAGNLITKNGLEYGAAIDAWSYVPTPAPVVVNNTIVDNGYSGISMSSGSVINNIVCFNGYGIGGNTPVIVRNNCVFGNQSDYGGVTSHPNDINLDPLFVNRSAGDYHLSSGSPCIDAGLPDAPYLPTTDIDCLPRVSGSKVDIGADEFGAQ